MITFLQKITLIVLTITLLRLLFVQDWRSAWYQFTALYFAVCWVIESRQTTQKPT